MTILPNLVSMKVTMRHVMILTGKMVVGHIVKHHGMVVPARTTIATTTIIMKELSTNSKVWTTSAITITTQEVAMDPRDGVTTTIRGITKNSRRCRGTANL